MGEGWHQPWCAHIELTEGCTRMCNFCGIHSIRSKPGNFKFMSLDTAATIAMNLAEFSPNARLEFAMHGEPLMHPNYLEIFALFRSFLPKTQMQVTTNGVKFRTGHMQQRLEELYSAGITFVMLDTYEPERAELLEAVKALTNIRVLDFYKTHLHPCHNNPRAHQRALVLLDDLGKMAFVDRRRPIFNHTGNNPSAPKLLEPLRKTCTTAFREVAINYDGTVSVCCMDWRRLYVCGVVSQERSLREIWWGEEFVAARAMLGNKNRNFGCCRLCDAGNGMRSGLLPKVGPVTDEHRAVVARVEAEGVNRQYGLPR